MAPLFLLTPATLAWSPIFGGYNLFLIYKIGQQRLKSNTSLGFGNSEKDIRIPETSQHYTTDLTGEEEQQEKQKLFIYSRIHANFMESVPFAVLMISMAELNGTSSRCIHLAFALLLLGRIGHYKGMTDKDSLGMARIISTYGTAILSFLFSLYNFYLYLPH